MINIDKHAESGCRALLPDRAPAGPAEVFSLTGLQTRIAQDAADLSNELDLRFERLDPSLDLPERRGSFSEPERDNILCLLASPDGRFGSLPINAAVQIYTSALGADQAITFRPKPDQKLWLRPSCGRLAINATEIGAGELALVTDESEIQILGLSDSEFVLLVLS